MEGAKNLFNLQNEEGNTVLHELVLSGKNSMAERLQSSKLIDPLITNKEGETAKEIQNKMKEEAFKEEIIKTVENENYH